MRLQVWHLASDRFVVVIDKARVNEMRPSQVATLKKFGKDCGAVTTIITSETVEVVSS